MAKAKRRHIDVADGPPRRRYHPHIRRLAQLSGATPEQVARIMRAFAYGELKPLRRPG